MPPAFSSAGTDAPSRCSRTVRPPSITTPVWMSTQAPGGSQAVAEPSSVTGSRGVVMGATTSSLPNANSFGTS